MAASDKLVKPTALGVIKENIPEELRALPQWVNWKYVWKEKRGVWDKPPYQTNGRFASSTDPATWSEFDEVIAAYEDEEGGFDGIGFCCSDDDPLAFMDLDDCLDDDKFINGVGEIVESVDSYTEKSPSGTGLRIIARGNFPEGKKVGKHEFYSHNGRYLTITGQAVDLYPKQVNDRQDELMSVYNAAVGEVEEKVERIMAAPDTSEMTDDDLALCDEIRDSSQKDKFEMLFDLGDTGEYGGDDSGADFALIGVLYWWTQDAAQICRIMMASKLRRPKWDDKRSSSTWLMYSIANRIAMGGKTRDADSSPVEDFGGLADEKWEQPEEKSVDDLFEELAVKQDYIDELDDERFLVGNLIKLGHIVNLVAAPGAGKTALAYYTLAPRLAEMGMKVVYIDCDSPSDDHKRMYEWSQKYGFRWLNPHTNKGKSVGDVFKLLKLLTEEDLKKYVFFFDTYKKFVDLMQKNQVKGFANLQRVLQGRGATSANLGHTNKDRDKITGALKYEGTGDVLADCDDLIYLEKIESEFYDGFILSTVWDQGDYAGKVRGIFKQISINILPDRSAVFLDDFVEIPDRKPGRGRKKAVSSDSVKRFIKIALSPNKELPMLDLISEVMGMSDASRDHTREIIRGMFRDGEIFHRRDGNKDIYFLEGDLY